MANILIVEDELAINELIKGNLELVGHQCTQAYDGKEALIKYQNDKFDLILLDVMLPILSGFDLISHFSGTPVIFVTAKENITDRLKGLRSGAEDYIVKPFEMLELIERVNIVLRRYQKEVETFTYKNLEVDFNSRIVYNEKQIVTLTPKEFDLLEILIINRNIALSREKLLSLAWDYDYEGDTRTVDVHIQKLRKKLDLENEIQTVYKMGYRLEVQ